MSKKNIQEMSNDCFLPFAVLGSFCKSLNIVGSHDTITYIIQTFMNDPCLPRNSEEILIQKTFDKFIWQCTVAYGIMVEVTSIGLTFGTLLLDLGPGVLPFPAWLPYKHVDGFSYWFAYSHQLLAGINAATFAIGYDTLIPSLMIQIVSKFKILQHRFENFYAINKTDNKYDYILKNEKAFISDCVKFHEILLSEIINENFDFVIFMQCSLSVCLICVGVLNIDKYQTFSQEWTAAIFYLGCMLSQIFILCAAGNEVTLVSSQLGEAVYSMNWTYLDTSTIKSLILIMNRSLHPIVFTSKNIVTLSLDSFTNLIKISYSTYNVLHRT
ncbi:odorant receptor Or1-like [Aphidius gifuensis]|uniref:odorant receptor Or1-like n=1 Tax=Aphidius gifuensis TaxID=684658 RepID=UPI001CDBE1EC|nr:odorant receptor Or1-like [Aphidius gifuensis]